MPQTIEQHLIETETGEEWDLPGNWRVGHDGLELEPAVEILAESLTAFVEAR